MPHGLTDWAGSRIARKHSDAIGLAARGYQARHDGLATDVTGGEQDWDMATGWQIIDDRVVDIVQPCTWADCGARCR
jgi:hypothetical protein